MDREMQRKIAEGAIERRALMIREWLSDPEFRAMLRRLRTKMLRKHRTERPPPESGGP